MAAEEEADWWREKISRESPVRRDGVDKLNMTSELFSVDSYHVPLTDGNPSRDVKVMRGRKKTKYGLKSEELFLKADATSLHMYS